MKNKTQFVPHKMLSGICRPESLTHRLNSCVKKYARLLSSPAFALTLAALAPLPASAQAVIYWGAAQNITADSDVVSSPGTALYAYTGGMGATVNGVTFTSGTTTNVWGNVSFNSAFTTLNKTAFTTASSPFGALSQSYSNILVGADYGGTGAGTVTLTNLTAGHDYSVQVWVNDPRSGTVASRTEIVTNLVATGSGNFASLQYNVFNAQGGSGQFSVGYFGATTNFQAFSLVPGYSGVSGAANSTLQLNAISVLDLGLSQRVWLGSGGASWGTPGSWSPGLLPYPSDAVFFNPSSTTLGTTLDTSYTVATLNVSNAPSAVTIGASGGDGGNTLTMNAGLNVFNASDSLTINDPVVLGGFQTWSNNGTMTVNAGISGSAALTISGSGKVTFTQPATYLYKTIINGGTLALSGSGSVSSGTIQVAGGAMFDVSGTTSNPYLLNTATLTNSSAGAVINGNINCTSATIITSIQPGSPSFIQTNGTMSLSSSTVVNINNPGAVLAAGNYTIIAAAQTGTVGAVDVSAGTPTVNLTGNGAVGNVTLNVDGNGNLQLVIATPDVWTGSGLDGLWTTANNWNPANEPNLADSILFNSSSVNNINAINQNDSSGGYQLGVTVLNPPGPVTIGGANALAIYAGGLNLSAASQSLTINAPLIINANQQWNVTNNQTLTIGGLVTTVSGGNVTVTGGGKTQMSASHLLDGLTNASAGSGDFTVNGILDLKGTANAINGLYGSGVVDNTAGSPAILTVGGNGDNSSNSVVIQNTGGALQLQVAGGSVQLFSTNTYSGGTIFNGGTLWFPAATATLGTGPVTFNPGSGTYTFNCAFTNALTLNGASGIAPWLRLGGGGYPTLDSQTWSGPVTVNGGFHMSGDNQGCTLTLSGPMNFGSGGLLVTNSGNNGPNLGYQVSNYGDALTGPISGSGGVTYNLSGANSRITVQGTNTYSGGTVVNGDPANPGGKLNIYGTANAITNYCFSTGTVTLNAGAVIESAPGSVYITNALILNGGTLEAEPQYNNYNQLFWTGPITLTADSALVQQATGALNANMAVGVNVSGPVNLNNNTLYVSNTVSTYSGSTISGTISGTGNIIYNGQGPDSFYLNGSNTFSGFIEPQLGTLNVGNSNALLFATLDMDPADSGTVTWTGVTSVWIGGLTGSRNLALPTGTATIGGNNQTEEYDGVLTGGNLVKAGSGTTTLTGANSFTGFITVNGGELALTGATSYGGNTTVNAGSLEITTPNLVFSSTVAVASGATLNLNFTGTNVVSALVLGGVSEPRGVYRAGTYAGAVVTGSGVIQVGATPDIWTGLTGNGDWSINNEGSPYNWNFLGVPGNYTDGSAVQFDDSVSSANTTVGINVANVSPSAVIFSNTVNSYTLNGSYGIAGGAALYKSGTNQVTLNTPNTFIGAMTLNGGKLTIGSAGSMAASYGGNITFTNGAALEYSSAASSTFSGNLTGPGSLLFDSTTACVLTLSGANTYSGTTTISNANFTGIRLSMGAANIPANTSFNIVGNQTSGGQLYINSAGTVSNNITMSGLGYNESSNPEGSLLLANGVTLSGTITTVSTNLATIPYSQLEVLNQGTTAYSEIINGQITGSGGMMFYGLYGGLAGSDSGGTVTITLANTGTPNNYLGVTEIYNQYTSHAGSGGPNNTTLKLGANEQIPNGPGYGLMALGGWNAGNANRSCTFELNGFNETINGLTTPVAGTLDNFVQNTTAGASTLTIGDGNTSSTYGGTIKDGGAGAILNVTKIGTGSFTNSGTWTTHGSITVSNGVVWCTAGACAVTNIYVATGGTLASSVNNYFGNPPTGVWTVSGTLTGNAANASGTSETMPATINLVNGGVLNGGLSTYGTFLPSGSVTTTFNSTGTNTISAGNLGMGLLAFNTPNATDTLLVSAVLGAASAKSGSLTKTGLGTAILSNTNIYTGGTAINAGVLLVTNTAGSGTGTGAVNINSGGTLGGSGIITGLVTNNAGGTLLPGTNGVGTLTLSGNLTQLSGSTNTFYVNGSTLANTKVVLGGAVTYAGVLNIVPSGTFSVGQTFTLFSGAGATSASSFIIQGSPGAGKAFSFANGVLSIVAAGPSGPAHLTNSISGSTLSLSWPAGQGWRLQMQTNSLAVGLRTNWVYLTDGTVASTNITVDATKPTVFYRLTYP